MTRHIKTLILISIGVVAVAAASLIVLSRESRVQEIDQLAGLLQLREGMTVAEVGAGTGWLALEVAAKLGDTGHVYTTELDPRRLDQIRDAVGFAELRNVTVIEAGARSANLPTACCDAVYMRRVYHHLADPVAIGGDIEQALKPGGRLVIIEFGPSGLWGLVGGMGTDRTQLVDEVTFAGFTPVSVEKWPGWGHYVAVFQKPVVKSRLEWRPGS